MVWETFDITNRNRIQGIEILVLSAEILVPLYELASLSRDTVKDF